MYPKPYLALVLTLFCSQLAVAQAPAPNKIRPFIAQDNKGPAVRERAQEARHVLRQMAQFPAEVRDAIPIVAQQPDLPGKLTDLAKKDDVAYINQILANHSKEVQSAVRTLLPWPKALELMAMHANLMRIFGDIAKKDGLATVQIIFKELESEDEQADASAVAWAKRLHANKTAVYRYIEAMTAYAQEKPKAEFLDFRYGLIYISKGNTATVYAMPPAPFTTYVMVNADLYPELADEMFEQWLHTDSRTDFDDVMQRTYAVYRQVFTVDFFNPEGRAERLRSAALLGKKLGDDFKEGKITLLLREPNLAAQAANLPALQQFVVKGAAMALQGDDLEKPKVPRKADVVVNVPADKPVRVVKAKDNPPAEPSPGSEPPAAKPAENTASVWYWYQNNLPVNWWLDTPVMNGFTPLFFGSLRLPPLPRHPQAPPDTPITPVGGTGTTIQEQSNRINPAFRRPPFVPDPFNRGGASRGGQPRIPGGVSVPANITPTNNTGAASSTGTVTQPTPGTGNQTPAGTQTPATSGQTGTATSQNTRMNSTTVNRGGSTMQPNANTRPMAGIGTTANQTTPQLPPGWERIVPGPGDDWKRFRGVNPVPPGTGTPGTGTPGTGTPGTRTPGTGGVTQLPPGWDRAVPGPGNDWMRFRGMMPPWWRGVTPMAPNTVRPAAPVGPRK